MKVSEVEELLQISRANIRFYEKEGLLRPERSSSGYRSYSEKDVQVLKEIIIFRKLGLSVAEIRDVLDGRVSVSDAVSSNIQHLQEQIEELSGAVELCKCICADKTADTDFDGEKYWTMLLNREKKGLRFINIVNDYVTHEKILLKNLFPYGCVSVLLVCITRGIISEFVLGEGFVFGFFYPFILFLIISVLTFPMFAISAKYRDADIEEEQEQKRTGLGWSFLKFIGMFFLLLFVTAGILTILEKVWFMQKIGKDVPFIITGMLNFLYFFTALYLWTEIVWLYSKNGLFCGVGGDGFKAHLPKKVKRKVLCLSIAIYMMSLVIYGNWYDCVTEDGVVVHHFMSEKEYTWEDVEYYTLRASFDGVLRYTIRMKDGASVLCLGGAVGMGNTDSDELVQTLTGKFADMKISMKVDDWDKLMEGLKYDYWKEYAGELRKRAEFEN